MLQDRFWKCTDRSKQVLETSVCSKVLDHGDTAFWRVIESVEYSYILLGCAKSLPFVNPFFQDISDFYVRDRYLFHAIDFEGRTMEHFLDRS